jgi:predicted RNA-binding protein with TRAM domain
MRFTPTEGYPGVAITILGAGFIGASAVTFNGTPAATFTVNTDGKITAYVPKGATTGRISVTTPTGTYTSRSDFTIRPFGFAPQEGPTGTAVVISGGGFIGASAVRFNGTSAAFTVNSDRKITAYVLEAATTGPISVVTPSGTLIGDSGFGVVPKVTIVSISPNPFHPYQEQSTTITWTQDREAWIEIFAKDSARHDAWAYDGFGVLPAGTHSIVWDGKAYGDGSFSEGDELIPDTYTVTVYGWDTTGSYIAQAPAQVTLANVSTVPAPVATIASEQQVSVGPPVTVLARVTWTSATPNICSYRLQRSVNGASFGNVTQSSPTATSLIAPVAVGNRYRFRVRATSCDGTVGAWMTGTSFAVRAFQQGAATYSGGWSNATLPGSWGGSVKTTSSAGSSATFTFTGQAVAWVGTKAAYGSSDIYVDDALFEGGVYLSSADVEPRYIPVAARWPGTDAQHTLTIVDGDGRIDVDGFVVFV